MTKQQKELAVLKTLVASGGGPCTRQADFVPVTGLAKGWARLMGAPTKRPVVSDTMEGRGLVVSEVVTTEQGREILYWITEKGRRLLADSL